MFGILARSLHTATRFDPPRQPDRAPIAPKSWNAPRHWTKPAASGSATRKETRRP